MFYILDYDLDENVQAHGNREILTVPFRVCRLLHALPFTQDRQMLQSEWGKWVTQSSQNYAWLRMYANKIVQEYEYRYPVFKPLQNLIDNLPNQPILPEIEQTKFPYPPNFTSGDIVEAYRDHFVFDCEDSHRWLKRDRPYWV